MFCPNCGKDCGDANFCPKCGTQLQQAVSPAVQSVWSVGMPCPHCGGTKLDGNNCAFCGAHLIVDIEPKEKIETKWSKIPLGVYEDVDRRGYLKLKEDCLIIKNGRKREYTIPYEQITGLEFTRWKLFVAGWLTIRWSENAHVPFPKSSWVAVNDETTFFITTGMKKKRSQFTMRSGTASRNKYFIDTPPAGSFQWVVLF